MTHIVQSKETLYSISKKYGVTVEQLISLNNLVSTNLSIGQNLIVRLPSPTTPTKPSNSIKSIFEKRNVFLIEKLPKVGYNTFTISFPTPSGIQKTGVFRDNYPSPNRVNAAGISYAGKNTFDSNVSAFQDLCPQPFYLEVLHHIAKNEGCFDAVNSYDKAIFSFGFLQFTGAQLSGSILSQVLNRFKVRDEYAFNDCFGQYGIDIVGGTKPIFRVETPKGILENDAAYTEVANNLQLTGAFVASSFRRSMIRAQVELALEEYVLKALAPSVKINVNGVVLPLNEILKTEGGFAIRVDLAVNRGLTGSLLPIQTAVNQVAKESKLTSGMQLAKINERRVVEVLAQNETDVLKKQRILKLLDGSFSFWK
ncbi:MAG: LysM peptidoglycan-binding domain-containing protein [Flectobacillus sp.]|uniref:LysM peptidoglycan-binding domain-containing protein n=1 Tax=Flectobacillus sp. TaxID=50419 RepID=UPI003B9A39D0